MAVLSCVCPHHIGLRIHSHCSRYIPAQQPVLNAGSKKLWPKKTPLALPCGVSPKAAQPPSTNNVRWFSSAEKEITSAPTLHAASAGLAGSPADSYEFFSEVVHS
jgi:hypothetical protein